MLDNYFLTRYHVCLVVTYDKASGKAHRFWNAPNQNSFLQQSLQNTSRDHEPFQNTETKTLHYLQLLSEALKLNHSQENLWEWTIGLWHQNGLSWRGDISLILWTWHSDNCIDNEDGTFCQAQWLHVLPARVGQFAWTHSKKVCGNSFSKDLIVVINSIRCQGWTW